MRRHNGYGVLRVGDYGVDMGTLWVATVTPHEALTSVHLAASTPNCTGSAALPLVHLFSHLNIFHIVHLPPLRLQPARALPLLFLLQRYLPFAPPAASASRPCPSSRVAST